MFLIAGIHAKVKEVGTADVDACPACRRAAALHVCVKYQTPHIFFIPTFRFATTYLATCPYCASVMELDQKKGKQLEHTGSTQIDNGDLHIAKDNSRDLCRHCGAPLTPGHRYCGHCGGGV